MSACVPQSHTATQEWQSFELRMRRRRVQRCVLRASLALEAGAVDHAREAIDEAALLAPGDDDVRELVERIAAAEAAPAALVAAADTAAVDAAHTAAVGPASSTEGADVRSSRPLPSLAAALALLAAGAGWFVAGHATRTTDRAHVPASTLAQPPSAPVPAPDTTVQRLADETAPAPVEATTGVETVPAPAVNSAGRADVMGTVATTGQIERNSPEPEAITAATAPAPTHPDEQPLPRRSSFDDVGAGEPMPVADPLPPPPRAVADFAVNRALPAAPSVALPLPSVPPPDPEAVAPARADTPPVAAPPPTAVANEQSVRSVLSRYEAAYNRLDAAAAGAIWPTVDRRALSRAFDGLASQTISLGRCDVRLTTGTAQAECTGSARWSPKVGGGTQTASRRWRFELENTGREWVIVSSTAR